MDKKKGGTKTSQFTTPLTIAKFFLKNWKTCFFIFTLCIDVQKSAFFSFFTKLCDGKNEKKTNSLKIAYSQTHVFFEKTQKCSDRRCLYFFQQIFVLSYFEYYYKNKNTIHFVLCIQNIYRRKKLKNKNNEKFIEAEKIYFS